jgi:hypothetical protein
MAQYQPGPNIINGRPVTIGSNGRPLQHYVGPCAYGPAIVGLIETAASRLDPRGFPDVAAAKNAMTAIVYHEFNRRKAVRDWTGFEYGAGVVFSGAEMNASKFNSEIPQCFPRYAKFLNDVVVAQQERQVKEAKAQQEREIADAKQKAEHEAQMAELARQQAEQKRKQEAIDAQRRADEAAQLAVIEQKRLAEQRKRDEEAAQARAARAAQEEKESAEHEAKMAEIERQRQAEIARQKAEKEEQWRASVQAAWNVPFLLNTNISEDLFRAVKNEVSSACGRKIRNQVKYDIRSPGTFYGTNTGDWAILRFSQWSVKVSKAGTITIWGDDAEAQNGFGNWLRVNYSCEVDLASKKIVNATIDMGRLPDPTN